MDKKKVEPKVQTQQVSQNQQVDLSKLSVVQLKAICYDEQMVLDQKRRNIDMVNKVILQKLQDAQAAQSGNVNKSIPDQSDTKEVEVKKEEKPNDQSQKPKANKLPKKNKKK